MLFKTLGLGALALSLAGAAYAQPTTKPPVGDDQSRPSTAPMSPMTPPAATPPTTSDQPSGPAPNTPPASTPPTDPGTAVNPPPASSDTSTAPPTYGKGWDAKKCASAQKAGRPIPSDACPPAPMPH
jgi:hypothetical protein